MDNLTPTNRGEQFLDNILRTLNDENVEVELVAGNDDEKFLDDILKAAGGDEPLYNLTERWRHQWWLRKIAEAIANGGGGSNWELLATKEFDVTTSSTSITSVGNVDLTGKLDTYTKNDIIVVHVRDKAGKRSGHFYGTDAFFLNYQKANNTNSSLSTRPSLCIRVGTEAYSVDTGTYGVYGSTLEHGNNKNVIVESRYHGTYSKTIDGTYKVDVYKLTVPEGMTLFD